MGDGGWRNRFADDPGPYYLGLTNLIDLPDSSSKASGFGIFAGPEFPSSPNFKAATETPLSGYREGRILGAGFAWSGALTASVPVDIPP